MVNFKSRRLIPKLIVLSYLRSQIVRLSLMLVIFLVLPSVGNLKVNNSQPSVYSGNLIEVVLPSPSPSPDLQIEGVFEQATLSEQEIIIEEIKGESEVKVGSKSYSHLCEGISESWKLVPNPDEDGQYIVCNSEVGQMASVGELNSAQNDYRIDNGLNALLISSELCEIARERAVEVADNFSHAGFEAAINRHNLQKDAVGENIASGPLTAVQFVEWSWDKSSGHRENMLGDWTEGCGGVYDKYAVFIFAR